jgi:hypothetical protein
MTQTRQVKTTLRGVRLSEFDDLIERLGLSPSGVLKLAVRRLVKLSCKTKQPPLALISKRRLLSLDSTVS